MSQPHPLPLAPPQQTLLVSEAPLSCHCFGFVRLLHTRVFGCFLPFSHPLLVLPPSHATAVTEDDDDKKPASGHQENPSEGGRKTSIADLDNLFGPVQSSKPGEEADESKWVSFSDESPERPLPLQDPAPPLPTSPPPDSPPRLRPSPQEASDSPASPPPTTTDALARSIPPPLVLSEEGKKGPEASALREDAAESTASPKEFTQGPRATPPPPPPPTYRAVVSSPGPCSGTGTGSGECSYSYSQLCIS